MKKFDNPFDAYELGVERPMSMELHPQGVKRYVYLYNHPIYYYHALQYTNGELYRAVLGYENCWNVEQEKQWMLNLDFLLAKYIERKEYYLEEIEITSTFTLKGLRWRRDIKPDVSFRVPVPYWQDVIEKGSRALARVNLVDKPNHVDIQFEDKIYTVTYMHYLRWRATVIRRIDENPRRPEIIPAGPKPKTSSKRREAQETQGVSRTDAVKALSDSMHSLRQRLRRPLSLRQARKKV